MARFLFYFRVDLVYLLYVAAVKVVYDHVIKLKCGYLRFVYRLS